MLHIVSLDIVIDPVYAMPCVLHMRFLADIHPEWLHHCNARRAPVRILV